MRTCFFRDRRTEEHGFLKTREHITEGVSKLKQCGLNQRSPAHSGKVKPKLLLAHGVPLETFDTPSWG